MFSSAYQNPVSTLIKCLDDVQQRWFPDETVRLFATKIELGVWPQTFSGTGCGFGGIQGRAITQTLTTLVTHRDTGWVLVYHSGKYAYIVREPNDYFHEKVMHRCVPGKVDFERSSWSYDDLAEKPSET